MKILTFLMIFGSLNVLAETRKTECSKIGRFSYIYEYEFNENHFRRVQTHYNSRDCTKPFQRDIEKGYFLEEHTSYLIVITEAESIPLDDIQKELFQEEPNMRYEVQPRSYLLRKSSKH